MKDVIDKIVYAEISDEMKQAYIDYAMSVITDRALPDVRDGLKPVHRRILYSMYELGLNPSAPHRKCARIVGDVLGKYHPHGDTSVYDALVKLAQDFYIRMPLVDGHGNFGSVDGDSASAMRYTEARMSPIALELLQDIKKDVVDFVDNFDGSELEPSVLPSRFPNLLVNGAFGIAVGMATNIPPHNLIEVINGVKYLMENPLCTIENLMKFIPSPDFPTGAIIINQKDMANIYSTGNGRIILRAKVDIEDVGGGKKQIIVSEIPYQVNKAKLIQSIDELIKEKKLIECSNVEDESDRNGMRIVIELKKGANVDSALNRLYKYTKLQDNFGVNMVALVNGEPQTLNLKQILVHYIAHQRDVITRRTKYDLKKALDRIHILEGLLIALGNIDKVIETIKTSTSIDDARAKLMANFGLSDKQAQAVLDIRLQRLTSLEVGKIKAEHDEISGQIKKYEKILSDDKALDKVIIAELITVAEKHKNDRRTKLVWDCEAIAVTEEIPDYNVTFYLTKNNYLKKIPNTSLRGAKDQLLKEGDCIAQEYNGTNLSEILVFTNKAQCYKVRAYEINDTKPSALGEYLPTLLQLDKGEKILKVVITSDFKGYMLFGFANGKIAKIDLSSYETKQNRSKLINAYATESPIVNIIHILEDEDVICVSSIDKVLIFNTVDMNSKTTKNSIGVQAQKSKNDSTMIMFELLRSVDGLTDKDYYLGTTGAIGCFRKKEDKIILKNA